MRTSEFQAKKENALSPEQIVQLWEQVATVIGTDPFILNLAKQSALIDNLRTESVAARLVEIVNDAADVYKLIANELNKAHAELTPELTSNLSQTIELATKWHIAHIFISLTVQESQQVIQYQDFRDKLNEQLYKLVSDMIIDMRAASNDLEPIVELLHELLFTIESGRTMRNLHFYPSEEYPPQAGDIINKFGHSVCFLSNPNVKQTAEGVFEFTGPAVAHNYSGYSFKVYENCKATFDKDCVVSRGHNAWLAFTKDKIVNGAPKVPLGTQLQRRVEQESGHFALERGQVVGLLDYDVKILWIPEIGSPYVETIVSHSQKFKQIELWVDSTDTRYLDSLGEANSAQLDISPNIFLPNRLPKYSVNTTTEYEPSEIRDLCKALETARFPVLIEQWNRLNRINVVKEALNDLAVNLKSNNSIHNDAKALRAYGCLPLLIINGAYRDGYYRDEYFKKEIEAMHLLGWEILIWQSNDNEWDNNLNMTVDALKARNLPHIHFVKGDEDALLRKFAELSASHEATLNASIIRENNQRPMLRRGVAYTMQELLNISDAQVENRPSVRLRLTTELLAMSQKIANAAPREQLVLMEELLKHKQRVDFSSVVGRTRLETDLCMYDFISMAGELAKSRLPLDHPAVTLRGITCGDLSPQALKELYQSGANFYTVRSPEGNIEGLAITFPPQVTERRAPGLSDKLGAPGKTGYLYWIWTSPDEQSTSHMVYHKLVSAFLLEQVTMGAELAAGAILTKNLPSLKAALLVAGFSILPEPIQIHDQPAVRVVFPLNRLNQENYHPALTTLNSLLTNEAIMKASESDIQNTAKYIGNQIEILSAWKQVQLVLEKTRRFEPLNLAITRLENALQNQDYYIDWLIYKESLLCLSEVLHEQTRASALERFKTLIVEIVPEDMVKLRRAERDLLQLSSQGTEQANDINHEENAPFVFNPANYPNIEVTIDLPEVDIEEIRAMYNQLSPEYRRHLDYIRNITHLYPENLHIERTEDRIEQYRWKRNVLHERYHEKGRVFKADVTNIADPEFTDLDRKHARDFQKFLDYGHAHIAADTYDMSVAARIMPFIEAYMGVF